jgi:hypothetical protein
MQNDYLTNKRLFTELNETKVKAISLPKKKVISNVNINELLNKVKIEEKTRKKKNLLIFVAFITFVIFFAAVAFL